MEARPVETYLGYSIRYPFRVYEEAEEVGSRTLQDISRFCDIGHQETYERILRTNALIRIFQAELFEPLHKIPDFARRVSSKEMLQDADLISRVDGLFNKFEHLPGGGNIRSR